MNLKFKANLFLLFLFFCITIPFYGVADNVNVGWKGQGKHLVQKNKSADSLYHIRVFDVYAWDAKLFNDKRELVNYLKCTPDTIDPGDADKIILKTNFEVDSNLLHRTLVFRYKNEGSFRIKINGKEIIKFIKPLKTKRFVLFEEQEEGYSYFTFQERAATIEIILINSELSQSINGNFQIGELKWKDHNTKSEYSKTKVSIFVSCFYLAIGIVLLILFLFYRKSLENYYFAIFCILFSFTLFTDLINLSSFVNALFTASSAYSLGFLATYLSIILTGKIRSKKPVTIFSIVLVVIFFIQFIFEFHKFSSGIEAISILYLSYNFFNCIYLLFQGSSKKKWEVKFIKYGFFSALFFIFGIFIIVIIVMAIMIGTKTNYNVNSSPLIQNFISGFYEYSRILGLILIPLTIATIIGKRNGLNQNELTEQLSEIKILSEQNIEKEKEKQIILSEQNILLEEKVQMRTKELQQEKEIVEIKNREILDSIEYALRIQTAILPPARIVKQHLIDSFILYKPKDIVAGDFYWMETTDNLVLFAACDCTGHGVSGAMVSLVCHNALNRAVREFSLVQPAAILNKTTEIVIENFAKSENEIKDGMDISICSYNPKTKVVEWAGANNPLWLLKDGEFVETKADKQSVGMGENNQPFTNHQFILKEGDSIYIFSDGFADQFGGEDGEIKLTKKRFKNVLLSLQNSSMHEQGGLLEKFINDYKGDGEQTDDILVMGVKV